LAQVFTGRMFFLSAMKVSRHIEGMIILAAM